MNIIMSGHMPAWAMCLQDALPNKNYFYKWASKWGLDNMYNEYLRFEKPLQKLLHKLINYKHASILPAQIFKNAY